MTADRIDAEARNDDDAAIDIGALKRRVLLTGALTLILFFASGYLLFAVGAGDWWLLVVMGLLYAVVVRPLMRPVREVTRLRRRLAYQAYLDGARER